MMIDTLSQYKFFLFGVDHTNTLGLARSLGEYGITDITAILICTHKPVYVNNCKYVKECVLVKSPIDGIDLLINKYKDSNQKHFLYTSSDDVQALLDSNYDRLQNFYNWGNCGGQNKLKQWFAKGKQCELAAKYGFVIPQTVEVSVGEVPQGLCYPVITKAADSLVDGWKHVSYICYNEDELKEAYTKISTSKIIIQEYVIRECETKFQSFAYNGKVLKNIPQCFDYEFSSQSYGNHHIYKQIENPELLEKTEQLLNEIHFQGLFEIEFMKGKNGKNYFLEINFRNSGVGYYMTHCGINLPVLYALSVITGNLQEPDSPINKLPVQTLKDGADFQCLVRMKGLSVFKWYKTRFKTADTYLLWNAHDKRPAFAFIKQYILTAIKQYFVKF